MSLDTRLSTIDNSSSGRKISASNDTDISVAEIFDFVQKNDVNYDALKELQSDFNSIKAMYENALKETTNLQQNKMVLPQSADGTAILNSKTITAYDVRLIQNIGRKSLNQLDEKELEKLENVAQKYYAEMGVKSPFFRRWFGDWRELDKSNVKVIRVNNINNFNAVKDTLRGNFNNSDTGWKNISVGRQGIDDTISYTGKYKVSEKTLSEIKLLIENSVLLDSEVTDTNTSKKKHPHSLLMHKLYSPVVQNGKNYIAKITIEEYMENEDTNKKFYNLRDIEISPRSVDFISNENSNQIAKLGDKISVSDLFSLVKTYDKDFKPKPCSLVLNDDGTPKEVYHGSDENFSKFDITKSRSWDRVPDYDLPGFYFSENVDESSSYGNIRSFYIKISNPYNGDVYSLAKEKGSYRDAYEYLVENGYDGIVDDELGEGFDEYIVLKPNNIKSVENGGTFSSWNDDILYSKEEIEAEEKLFSATDEVKIKFSQKVDAWYNGDLKEDDYFELGDTPLVLKALGTKDLPMVYDMNVMYKMTGGKHSIYKDDIKELPQAINNPIMVFKSSSVNNAYVLVTELSDKVGDAVIVAVHLNRYQDRIRINKIASAYGKIGIENFVNTESERGQLKYVDTKKCQQWSTSRGLQLPKLVQSIADNDSILQKEDIVNTYFMNYGKNYSSDSVLKSKESTGSEVVENIDPGVRDTADDVEASYFKLKKEVQKKLDEHIKKYGAIKKGEDAVRDAQFPAQTSDDRYVRRFTRTAFEADTISDEVASQVAEEVANGSLWTTYTRVTDKRSVEIALNRFKSIGYEKMLEEWEGKIASNERIEKSDIAKAMVLVQEASKRGDMKTAMGLIAEIAAEGTRAGQLVQSLSLLKKLSGQANVYYIEKTIQKIQQDIDKKYSGKFSKKKHVVIKVPEDLLKKYKEVYYI